MRDQALPGVTVDRFVGDQVRLDKDPVPGANHIPQRIPIGGTESLLVKTQQSQALAHGQVGLIAPPLGGGERVFRRRLGRMKRGFPSIGRPGLKETGYSSKLGARASHRLRVR